MAIKGMIFDMDGTLANTLPAVLKALREMFAHFTGREYADAEIPAMFGPSEEGMIRLRVAEGDYPAALETFLDRYAAYHAENEPFPGVVRLLKTLEARGIRRAIVTGKGPGTAEISMRLLEFAPYIETLVTGSPNGAAKPEAIRQVLDAWNLSPAEAAYVGDVPYDMQAAREAGVLPLGAAWAKTASVREGDGAARLFYSVEELIEWVGSI